MPRRARLDAPGTLHHVMVRGIERRRIVNDVADRKNFVKRLGELSVATNTSIYAWALLTNHAHILLRSSEIGLSGFMRRFLTGYAITYNRRHRRWGHLFQNRYKSIVCDEDAYFQNTLLLGRLSDTSDALFYYPRNFTHKFISHAHVGARVANFGCVELNEKLCKCCICSRP